MEGDQMTKGTVHAAWANVTVTGPTVWPWGKHKGKALQDAPRDYLEWAVHNADAMKPELRAELEKILGLPPGSTGPPPSKPSEIKPDESLSQEDRSQLAQVKKAWAKDQARLKELETENRELRAALDSARKDKPSDVQVFRRIVKQWFGSMSRRFHPDAGGSLERQTVLNLCYSDLMGRLTDA
jgi:hypothetical protein